MELVDLVCIKEIILVDEDAKEEVGSKEDQCRVGLAIGHCSSYVGWDYDEAAHSEPTEEGRVFAVERSGTFEGVVPSDDLEAGSSGNYVNDERCYRQLNELVAVEYCCSKAQHTAKNCGENDEPASIY